MFTESELGTLRSGVRRLRALFHSAEREVRFRTERVQSRVTGTRTLPPDLGKYGKSIFSQNDEDGILERIFFHLGAGGKFFVEIGVGPPWRPTGFASIEEAG